ncbi:MAG: TonB-dependent receptor plug domain-containing protein [Bacteroidota bacterium]
MKNSEKILMTVLLLLTAAPLFAQVHGEIRGRILDKESKAPLVAVTVAAYVNDKLVAQDFTNEKGYYSLKPLSAGEYVVKTYLMGYTPVNLEKVIVNTQNMSIANFNLESTSHEIIGATVIDYIIPLIEPTGTGCVITSADIEHMPYTDVQDVAATTAGIFQSDYGEDLNVRGSRSESTQYIIDGMKVIGSFNIPKNAIKEIKVLTGGIPAMFGDATGGIIMVTTKGYTRW